MSLSQAGEAPSGAVAAPPFKGPLGRFRDFSADGEKLALQWSGSAETPMPWVPDPSHPSNPGVEGGVWLTAAPYRGWAKPLRPGTDTAGVAAREKIASDLAYDLGLPVPPVTLYRRSNAPEGEGSLHCVSAVVFPQVHAWGDVVAMPFVATVVKAAAAEPMSAMMVFDTWLTCADHFNHPGNLLVTVTSGQQQRASFAFIDFSWSMTHIWSMTHVCGSQGYQAHVRFEMYDPSIKPVVPVVAEAVAAIQAVDDRRIDQIVTRIPDAFLPPEEKAVICSGLKYRRDNLKSLVSLHPEVSL